MRMVKIEVDAHFESHNILRQDPSICIDYEGQHLLTRTRVDESQPRISRERLPDINLGEGPHRGPVNVSVHNRHNRPLKEIICSPKSVSVDTVLQKGADGQRFEMANASAGLGGSGKSVGAFTIRMTEETESEGRDTKKPTSSKTPSTSKDSSHPSQSPAASQRSTSKDASHSSKSPAASRLSTSKDASHSSKSPAASQPSTFKYHPYTNSSRKPH